MRRPIKSNQCGNNRVLAAVVAQECRKAGLPPLRIETEYQFDEDRRWRFDVAIVQTLDQQWIRVALELDGGLWMGKSAHAGGTGGKRDREKDRGATELGWHVLRITTDELSHEPGKIAEQVVRIVKRKLESKP